MQSEKTQKSFLKTVAHSDRTDRSRVDKGARNGAETFEDYGNRKPVDGIEDHRKNLDEANVTERDAGATD